LNPTRQTSCKQTAEKTQAFSKTALNQNFKKTGMFTFDEQLLACRKTCEEVKINSLQSI
jgi:hypothetical protein